MSSPKVTSATLKKFFAQGIKENFKTGEVVIELSQSVRDVFYITEGFVKASSHSADGEDKLYAIYKAGEIFPLASALKDDQRNLRFETLDKTTLFRVSKESFRQFLSLHPEVLTEVVDRLVNLVNIYIDRVDNLSIVNSYQKIVSRLLFFSWRFGEKTDQRTVITTPLTHLAIANSLGMSRETVSRGLKKLEQKKLVSFESHHLIIPNQEALEKELQNAGISELADPSFSTKHLALILLVVSFADLLGYLNIS